MNKFVKYNYISLLLIMLCTCMVLTGCKDKTVKVTTPLKTTSIPTIKPTEVPVVQPDNETNIDSYLKSINFMGTVLISHKNEISYEKSFGLANKELKTPNQNNTIYEIGSDTKQFVATGILLLQEEGKLSITDLVSKYLPDFKNGDKITLKNLLNMNSGIVDYMQILNDESGTTDFYYKNYDKDYVYNLIKNLKLSFVPDEKKPNFTYSNSNYYLLAKIISIVTKESYEDFLTQKILTPLNMKNTSFDLNNCTGVGYLANGKPCKRFSKELVYGCGAMASTTEDLKLWVDALMGGKVLSSKSMDIMFECVKPEGSDSGYGCGWFIDGDVRTHNGNTMSYNSMIFYNTKTDLCIICLSNVNWYTVNATSVATSINDIWK